MLLRHKLKARLHSSARYAVLGTASWITIASGCTRSHTVEIDPNTEPALVALMEDGELPAGMVAGASASVAPPRFCDFQDFPSEDGGVDEPPFFGGFAGIMGGGAGGTGVAGTGVAGTGPVGGMAPPVGGAAGMSTAGTGEGGGSAGAGAGDGTAGMSAMAGEGGASGANAAAGSGGAAGMVVGGAGGVAGTVAGAAGIGGVGGFPMGGFGGDGDGDGNGSGCQNEPIGFWRFDDCNEFRSDLQDSSNEGHTAFRSVDVVCREGQEGQAVSFQQPEDLVYVPDQPAFALQEGVTVASWVFPNAVNKTSVIFRKRDDANSAFTLAIQNKRFVFAIKLLNGRIASVSAPAKPGIWQHVAATYDGEAMKLYLEGSQVAETRVKGTIVRGAGPLLMGNDISQRKLDGRMDNAWFNTLAATPDKIMQLTCVRQPPTIAIDPVSGPSVPAGTVVDYQVSLTDHSTPVCEPSFFELFASLPSELQSDNSFNFVQLNAGETTTTTFSISSGEETEPDTYPFTVNAFSFDGGFFNEVFAEADYTVAEPTGCFVRSSRALTIRDVSVVDDPIRTSMDGDPSDPRTGAWAFGRMMERLSPTVADAPDHTEHVFRTFLEPTVVNGFEIPTREAILPVLLDPWPRTPDGKLDLARAPLNLLAIVNRLDLKDLASGKAGEGRLVYGVQQDGFPLEFTVILEYFLPASTEEEYAAWANAFHDLQELPFPSEEYNAALQAITDRFTARDAFPGAVNGSSLIDLRTNEIALSFVWQLREFRFSPETGFLEPRPVFQTPDAQFNFSDRLGRFINENEEIILTEKHEVPLSFEGEPFQASAIFNNIDIWDAPGVSNPEARHKFSLNTCNGCHGGESNVSFLQIAGRFQGEQSQLSPFLTGTTVFDPVTGEPRRLAELSRRRGLLEAVVCEP